MVVCRVYNNNEILETVEIVWQSIGLLARRMRRKYGKDGFTRITVTGSLNYESGQLVGVDFLAHRGN